jgi:hypothetical protein
LKWIFGEDGCILWLKIHLLLPERSTHLKCDIGKYSLKQIDRSIRNVRKFTPIAFALAEFSLAPFSHRASTQLRHDSRAIGSPILAHFLRMTKEREC